MPDEDTSGMESVGGVPFMPPHMEGVATSEGAGAAGELEGTDGRQDAGSENVTDTSTYICIYRYIYTHIHRRCAYIYICVCVCAYVLIIFSKNEQLTKNYIYMYIYIEHIYVTRSGMLHRIAPKTARTNKYSYIAKL